MGVIVVPLRLIVIELLIVCAMVPSLIASCISWKTRLVDLLLLIHLFVRAGVVNASMPITVLFSVNTVATLLQPALETNATASNSTGLIVIISERCVTALVIFSCVVLEIISVTVRLICSVGCS